MVTEHHLLQEAVTISIHQSHQNLIISLSIDHLILMLHHHLHLHQEDRHHPLPHQWEACRQCLEHIVCKTNITPIINNKEDGDHLPLLINDRLSDRSSPIRQ